MGYWLWDCARHSARLFGLDARDARRRGHLLEEGIAPPQPGFFPASRTRVMFGMHTSPPHHIVVRLARCRHPVVKYMQIDRMDTDTTLRPTLSSKKHTMCPSTPPPPARRGVNLLQEEEEPTICPTTRLWME